MCVIQPLPAFTRAINLKSALQTLRRLFLCSFGVQTAGTNTFKGVFVRVSCICLYSYWLFSPTYTSPEGANLRCTNPQLKLSSGHEKMPLSVGNSILWDDQLKKKKKKLSTFPSSFFPKAWHTAKIKKKNNLN